jgi:formylglycine-generating enzyme required for sulfatase activity
MKRPTANFTSIGHRYLKPVVMALVVAALSGVAFSSRRPDLSLMPERAALPVILTHGSTIYVQKYEVTVAEWNICHAAGDCALALHATGGRSEADMPATGLSYVDVSQYLSWINAKTEHVFRLPKMQEWEYLAAEVLPITPDPLFTDPELSWASAYLMEPQTKRSLQPQGAFSTTSHGIVDLNGSVWEWTQDCYAGADSAQKSDGYCPAYFVGGEHIAAVPFLVRDPARGGCAVGTPPAHLGMRLVSDQAF